MKKRWKIIVGITGIAVFSIATYFLKVIGWDCWWNDIIAYTGLILMAVVLVTHLEDRDETLGGKG